MEFKKEIDALRNSDLLLKSLQGQIDPAEQEKLQAWITSSKENRALHDELFSPESRSLAYAGLAKYPADESYANFVKKLPKRKFHLWNKIAAIAAVFFLIGFAFIYFGKKNRIGEIQVPTVKQDFNPGQNKATLILANGRKVSLSSNQSVVIIKSDQFQYEDGSRINPGGQNNRNELQTITTPNSGFYQVILSDGTKVYLNSASSLRFPAGFSGTERRVEVTGEAYFEVAKALDAANGNGVPFIVETVNQEIEVLGTHFNVNNYDSAIRTTLIKGAVKIKSLNKLGKQGAVVLKPGQQSILTGNNFEVKSVDTDIAVAWKNGYFKFDEESLERIMNQVARWYNVKIYFSDEKLKEETFSGVIKRDIKASELLKVLEKAGDVRFIIQEDKITVTKK